MRNPGRALVLLAAILLAAATAGCGKDVDKSDTVRWINGTQALRAEINGWDYAVFGGEAVKDETAVSRKERLAEEWGVTDRASADETVDWLLSEGHRMSFTERMDLLAESGLAGAAEGERADFIYGHFELTEEEAQRYARFYKAYEEAGVDAVSAWDYSRAISVLADGCVAGYYTKEEALDKSLEIAGVIQGIYGSWDAFADSYLLGYEYASEESSQERRGIYETLKVAEDSVYLLDWNLALEKSW